MKNWNYINGAEVGNEAKVTPVDPSPKTGSKPNPDNNQNPKKNPKKEMTDKNGRTFREVLEEVKKTGNARYTSRADVISHLDTDLYDICKKVPAGSPSFAYVRELQKTGWDIGTISKYSKEIGQIIDKYAKVGNSTEKLFYGLSKDAEKEEEKSDEAIDELKKTGNKAGEKLGKELHEVGNYSSDDKFAYVMREFEEGKLKTPDGKVVTDPAQAKAIAYSESKKTENGLARARNAMEPTKYKGYTIKFRPNSQKYYISSGPGDTYVREYAYKEYASVQDAKDAIDHLK